jgi:hypothetical protein
MVSGRHAERFNRLGQARWAGFLYSSPRMRWPLLRPVLYHGHFGTAPYQRVLHHRADTVVQRGSALLPLSAPAALLGCGAAPWWPWALTVPAASVLLVAAYAVLAAVAIRPHRAEPAPLRLRCLAGALHAVQPFVRTWGRLRGHPLRPAPVAVPPWDGDRTSWLVVLQRELARGWRSVTPGGPTDRWDLSVSAGPCVRYRLTTAVVWRWQPRWRGRLVPRRGYVAALAVAAVAPLAAPWLALVPAALLGAGAVEATVLRRAVRRAVHRTVAGAAAAGSDAGSP